jgi:hypothetical protein
MELWQMDGMRLCDGSELKVVTGIDDHSLCVRDGGGEGYATSGV